MKVWIIELHVGDEWFPAVDIWFDSEEDAHDYIGEENLDRLTHRVVRYERATDSA